MNSLQYRLGTFLLTGLLLAILASSEVVGQTSQPDRTAFDAALSMLRDTSLRMDIEGIQLVRTRLEPFVDDPALAAEAHYSLGLADIASLFTPTMNQRASNPEETKMRVERAVKSLTTSTDLDDASVEAWSLLALAQMIRSSSAGTGEDEKQSWRDASAGSLDRARRIDAEHPVMLTVAGMTKLFGGGSDAMAGMKLLTQAMEAFRAGATGDRSHDAGWWPLMARGIQARVGMMVGRNSEALALVEECLALEPDFPMAALMKPRLESIVAVEGEGYAPIDADLAGGRDWTALSTDEAGDGRQEGLADGKAFACEVDSSAGKVWFRFELHGAPNAEAFGVNVVVDDDADQATGNPWWGTNTAFTWDRLISVWVAKKDNGKYGGTVGVGDRAGMGTGDMASRQRGGIDFAILEEENAIVIGVPRAYLSDGDRINIIGAVGSNQLWNDDLQDEGFATIELR